MITIHGTILNLIPIRKTKSFTFLDLILVNEINHLCLHHLKLKLQYDQTQLQPKLLVYIRMQNSIIFGTEYFSQKILTQYFNYLEKLLVIHSFLPGYSNSHISQTNPQNTVRIGLHDKLLDFTPIFTPSWFSDAFITLFGYPCNILTQCGIHFSTFLFMQTR